MVDRQVQQGKKRRAVKQNTFIPRHVRNSDPHASSMLHACPQCGRSTGPIAVEDMVCPYRKNDRKCR